MTLPNEYIEEMKILLADEYELYENCLQQEGQHALRVNTNKISVEEFKQMVPFTLAPIPWIDNGFFCDMSEGISKHPYYFAGLYYIQEASAMTPANRLPITPGDKILDMCAAPGGKATELGAKLSGQGMLIANDISNSRAKALLKNLELFGLGNICVTSENPQKLATIYPAYFDKILIDAPCSGEGMFRREPRMVEAWCERGPTYYQAIQQDLILLGAQMLKAGGQLLYSTCTFSKQENEAVIAYLLDNCPDMKLSAIEAYEGFTKGFDGLDKCVRIFPHKMNGEGHFMALLEKQPLTNSAFLAEHQKAGELPLTSDELPVEVAAFLTLIKRNFQAGYFKIIAEKLYFIATDYEINKNIRYLRSGLYLGEIKKKRFEPSQALAMTLRAKEFVSTIDLPATDMRIIKYLKGETIDVSDCLVAQNSGWQLVCVDGYPIGFGKLQNGILKNKYYSGWRMN